MRILINEEDKKKFFKIVLDFNYPFSCKRIDEEDYFYISKDLYETLLVNGIKVEKYD